MPACFRLIFFFFIRSVQTVSRFRAYISFGHTSPASSVSDYISVDFEAVLKQLTSTVQLGLVAMHLRAFGR